MNRRKMSKPIRMWIDGKAYNIKRLEKLELQKRHNTTPQNIEKSENNPPVSIKFRLPTMYYIQLDRFRIPQISDVECDTKTIITYPKHGKDGLLEIAGNCEESVEEARDKLHSYLAKIREQTSALQFISIPLLSDEIKKNFEEFKEKVLSENCQGVEKSIFQSALKLHLTITVFTLLDDKEKQEAIEVLEECRSKVFKSDSSLTTQKIRVQGLNCMNDNLSKVNVLYANAAFSDQSEGEKSLQEIANLISESFYERGLAREYQDNVKLHMTLMNTKYRSKKQNSPRKKWAKREPFNATKIIEKYKDYYFGETNFDTMHLSLMTSKGEDGFYTSLATIKI